MRIRSLTKICSAGVLILAAAACGAPGNNLAGNAVDATAGNEAAPAADNEAAPDANQASPADNGSAAAAETYRASGSEPFWSLTIDGRIVYHPADGPDVTAATPAPQSTRAGPMYVTPAISVRINQFQRCTEPSGAELHDTVTVTIGAQTLTGCGGATTHAAE